MTAKGDRAASGVQVITYIVIFEMIMQMYLLCKNTSHTLPLISAVHCRFYFNSKVYLQSEDSGSHRRKFQHRCLVCSDNRIPTPLSAVSSVMSKHSLPLPRVGQHLGPKESSGSAPQCHFKKFLSSKILLSFISLWLTPLSVCILLDEFSGMRVHLYDFSSYGHFAFVRWLYSVTTLKAFWYAPNH